MIENDLKEILGFDPETGNRVEDRGELRPIEKETTTSKDIQEKFRQFIDSKYHYINRQSSKIYPEILLYVGDGDSVEREYFSLPQEDDFSFKDIRTKVIFKKKDDGWQPLELRRYGEHHLEAFQDEIVVWFNDFREGGRSLNPDELRVDARLDKRELTALYNINGDLRFVAHSVGWMAYSDRYFGFGRGEAVLGSKKFSLSKLLKEGSVTQDSQDDNYIAVVNKDDGLIEIKRSEHGNTKDKIKVPLKINRAEIIDKLFSPTLLNDPFEVPPDVDLEWRTTDLLDTVGIKWERS